jgi:phosphohistidine phosphatase
MRNVMSGQSSNNDILIFVMRHGEAEQPIRDDRSRRLTHAGQQQCVEASEWLVNQYCPSKKIDLTLVSPYKRAMQSSEIMLHTLTSAKIEENNDIVPNGSAALVNDYVAARIHSAINTTNPIRNMLIVSHMPFVSYLVDALCDSYTTSLFSTASIAVIKYSPKTDKGMLVHHYQSV